MRRYALYRVPVLVIDVITMDEEECVCVCVCMWEDTYLPASDGISKDNRVLQQRRVFGGQPGSWRLTVPLDV